MNEISVCIPSYNYGCFIGQAIKSVLAQTYQDFELLIVDNSSTDNTEEVVKDFLEVDKRIKFIKNKTNIGFTKNLNKCLSLCSGKYICILPADDMLKPDFLERGKHILDLHPNVGLVYSSWIIIDKNNKTIKISKPFPKDRIVKGSREFQSLLLCNHMQFATVMVRRNCYENLGGFDETLVQAPDWEMWARISLHYDIAYIATPLGFYRLHSDRLTIKNLDSNQRSKELRKALKKILSDPFARGNYSFSLKRNAFRHVSNEILEVGKHFLHRGYRKWGYQNVLWAVLLDPIKIVNIQIWKTLLLSIIPKVWIKQIKN